MVMHLPMPTMSNDKLIDGVVSERKKGRNAAFFMSISAEWKTKAAEYLVHEGAPALVNEWPAAKHRKKSFLNLYKSPKAGSTQGKALASLRDFQFDLCPACGESGRPNTLDHYLPKATYPHFCISPMNLFPMCDACQQRKGEKTGDANDPRFFIHPYFHQFAAQQIVELTIAAPFSTPTFSLAPHPSLTGDQLSLVQAHLRELEIQQRYGHFFRNEHRRLLRTVEELRNSQQEVAANLNAFRISRARPSVNSWEHVFLVAVLASDSFMTYLKTATFPPYL